MLGCWTDCVVLSVSSRTSTGSNSWSDSSFSFGSSCTAAPTAFAASAAKPSDGSVTAFVHECRVVVEGACVSVTTFVVSVIWLKEEQNFELW